MKDIDDVEEEIKIPKAATSDSSITLDEMKEFMSEEPEEPETPPQPKQSSKPKNETDPDDPKKQEGDWDDEHDLAAELGIDIYDFAKILGLEWLSGDTEDMHPEWELAGTARGKKLQKKIAKYLEKTGGAIPFWVGIAIIIGFDAGSKGIKAAKIGKEKKKLAKQNGSNAQPKKEGEQNYKADNSKGNYSFVIPPFTPPIIPAKEKQGVWSDVQKSLKAQIDNMNGFIAKVQLQHKHGTLTNDLLSCYYVQSVTAVPKDDVFGKKLQDVFNECAGYITKIQEQVK